MKGYLRSAVTLILKGDANLVYADLISNVTDYHGPLLRNIKGIRESQHLFDDLGDETDAQVAFLTESQETVPTHSPLITRPFDYGTVITFPFLPVNWQGTRFSDGMSYGVWYGAVDLQTTVYETVHHWSRLINDSYGTENRVIVSDRRVLRTMCNGILVDLRGKEKTYPDLINKNTYIFTQSVGSYLHDQHQNGLLVQSARCNGFCAAILNPSILSNPTDFILLTYSMNPAESPKVSVERTPGDIWLTI